MTTIALAQIVHDVPAALRRFSQRLSELVAGIDEARLLATRYKALSRMTDAQLADRGLRRADIPQAVLNYSVRA
jgi:uncharacterized protein YjiS (DUF1127 family)